MDKVLNLTYTSSLTKLCEANSSFDTGVLRICYAGNNRNGSHISKEALQKSIKTIYNCPVVCNYDRESDTLGGHDIEVVRDASGELRIVNATQPVGIIPESSRVWFEEYEEEDGTVREYLYAEVLLWKRQEAYCKIKENGITAHSMEIMVKSGGVTNGIYYIDDFEFTAFALIGVEPCFESSSLEMFSKQDFKQQLSEMMQDLKGSFGQVTTSSEVDNTYPQNYLTEGGKKRLEDKMKLIAKYGVDIKSLDFSIENIEIEELTKKLSAMTGDEFSLTENVINELSRVLGEEKVEHEWGESTRYLVVDYDPELNEVYCWDSNDWLLYGFTYTSNGDSITIDFDSKKRKKYVIADFDEGEQPSPFVTIYNQMEEKLRTNNEWEAKYQTVSATVASMEAEVNELRQFKADTETAIEQGEKEAVFAQFEDLVGVEEFEALREAYEKYDVKTLEEKCYAIRGKNIAVAKFSHKGRFPKLKVENSTEPNEPYGGIFAKYGIEADN